MGKQAQPPRLDQHRNGTWYIVYSAAGRSQRVSTRTKDVSEAQEVFAGWLTEHKAARDAPDGRISLVRECVEVYLEQHVPQLGAQTRKMVENHLRCINAYFGDMKVADVDRQHLDKYRKMRVSGEIRTGKRIGGLPSVYNDFIYFNAALSFAARKMEPRAARLDDQTRPFISLPDPPPPRDRVLSVDELKMIREAMADVGLNGTKEKRRHPDKISPLETYVALLQETGCRSAAAMELNWGQVDFPNGLIYFNPYGRKQTRKKRPTIPMSDFLREVLERSFADRNSSFVCGGSQRLNMSFRGFMKRIGMENVTPHTFRHTWATHAVACGISLAEVADMLGDSIMTVHQNYHHLQPDRLRDALETMSRARGH